MRIVFPTKDNMSYISHSASSIEEAEYLTVLDVSDNDIVGVETLKNQKFANNEEFVNEFKENNFDAIIVPKTNALPLEDLKNAGICVYNDEDSQVILNAFSDYMNQKLALA